MTTQNDLLRDHEATYHSFLKASGRGIVAIVILLALMAIFLL